MRSIASPQCSQTGISGNFVGYFVDQ